MIIKNFYGLTREEVADWFLYTEEGKRAVTILNGINERRHSPILDEDELANSFITSMEDECRVHHFLEKRTGLKLEYGGGERHFEFHLWEQGDSEEAKKEIRHLNSLPDIMWYDGCIKSVEVKSIHIGYFAGENELKAHLIHKMHFMNIHGADTVAFVVHHRNEFEPTIMLYSIKEGWVN